LSSSVVGGQSFLNSSSDNPFNARNSRRESTSGKGSFRQKGSFSGGRKGSIRGNLQQRVTSNRLSRSAVGPLSALKEV
jgi:hypothetical protein